MDGLQLPYAFLKYEAPIIHITFKDKAEIGYFEIRELISSCEKLSGGHPYYVLSDSRTRMNVTPQGRRLSSDKKAAPLHRATAVLIESKMMKTAANFFGAIARPRYTFKVFTDKHQAIGWLKDLYEFQAGKENHARRRA